MMHIPTRIYFAKNSIGIILKINKLSNEIFANQLIFSIHLNEHRKIYSNSTGYTVSDT
jgi:hypothetical protein